MSEIKIKRIPQRGQVLVPETHANGVPYLFAPGFDRAGGVRHAFSTRLGGVSTGPWSTMNLSFTRGDDEAAVHENFKRMAEVISAKEEDIVCAFQTHTSNIRTVTAADRGKGVTRKREYTDVDGLVTDEPSVTLCIRMADCVPLLFADPEKKAIGMAHAGWRGSVLGIGSGVVKTMGENYGTRPEDLYAVIGPSICGSCYEVGEDVASGLRDHAGVTVAEKVLTHEEGMEDGKYLLDLHLLNLLLLKEAGVPEDHIFVTDVCTKCNPSLLFSHRVMGEQRGNLAALLKLA